MLRSPDPPTKYHREAAAIKQRLAENKQAREEHAKQEALLTMQLRRLEKDEQRRLHTQKRADVAQLAADAGLLAYELGTLEKAFADLAGRLQDEQQ